MNKRKIGISFICGLALIGGLAGVSRLSTNAENPVVALLDEYDYDEVIEVPHHLFEVGEQKIEAEGTVIFPNGYAYQKSSVRLNQYGLYKVVYSKEYNGKKLYKENQFIVRKDLVTAKNPLTKIYRDSIPAYALEYTSTNGVYVELAKGDSITFEQEFEASSFEGQNFITGFVTPKVSEEYDMSVVVVTLTDAVDPSIYLKWELNTNPNNKDWQGISYMRTCGNGQTIGGWNTEKGYGYFQNNMGAKLGAIPFNNRVFTGLGTYKLVDPSDYPFRISFDNETLITNTNGFFVSDYDDAKCYNKYWDGFPSGKCKLSVSADKYVDSYARFCITSVDGLNLSTKKSDITNTDIIDVDFDTDHMPEALASKWYKIPEAKSVNDYKINTKVYYNYGSSNQVLAQVKNGSFLPTKSGVYTIVYYTTNEFGKEATKLVQVHCGAEIPEISGEIASNFVTNCNIGEFVNIPELNNLNGGSGELVTSVYATLGNERVEISDGVFQPLKVGTWEVSYEVKDYNNVTKVFSRDLEVASSTVPALANIENCPEYFLNALEVELPVVYGYEFNNGVANKKICDVEVIDKNGSKTYTNGKFSPNVILNGDTVRVNFKINGDTVYSYDPKVIILYDDNSFLHFENYFLGEGFGIERKNSGVSLTHTQSNAHWNFFNRLIAENFELVLNNESSGKTNFSKIVVTIKDMLDPTIAASVSIFKEDGVNKIQVGSKSYDFDYNFSNQGMPLTIGFNNGQFVVNAVRYTVLKTNAGETFKGFTSDFVYVDVETFGSVGTSYIVSSLNGNNFVGSDDLSEPEFHICGTYAGKFDIGTVYKVNRAVFNDVISPYYTGSLTVKDKNNEFVTALDGTVLKNVDPRNEYEILLQEYGAITFTYKFSDKSPFSEYPNEKQYIYKVNCADFTLPEIILTSSWTKEAKVGDVIVMPNFTVQDNYSSSDKLTVFKSVVTPYGFEILLEEDENAIRVNYPGTYTFKVIVMDEYGNTQMGQYPCVVK